MTTERADQIEAELRAAGGKPVQVVPDGQTFVVFTGEPRREPVAGDPVALRVADRTWHEGHPGTNEGGYRAVTGTVTFNQSWQVWVAREEVYRACAAEDRLPSTRGFSTEAAPWPIGHVAALSADPDEAEGFR